MADWGVRGREPHHPAVWGDWGYGGTAPHGGIGGKGVPHHTAVDPSSMCWAQALGFLLNGCVCVYMLDKDCWTPPEFVCVFVYSLNRLSDMSSKS